MSSRHYPNLQIERHQEVDLDKTPGHRRDIAEYVRSKLVGCNEQLLYQVVDKARGIFMWVVLIVAVMNKAYHEGKLEAMQKTLDHVPGELETLFWTLLTQDNPDKHETILLLQWVLFAKDPLESATLCHAMLAGINPGCLKVWDRLKVTDNDIWRRITSSSRGLVEPKSASFIRKSVSDFLLRNNRLQSLDETLEPDPVGMSHDRLKDCCISYMTADSLPLPASRMHAENLLARYPFLKYASVLFLHHAEAAEERHIKQAKLLLQLNMDHHHWERVRLFHRFYEEEHGCGCIKGTGILYMSVAHGYNNLTMALLAEGADVNAQGGYYGTALQAAIHQQHKAMTHSLLSRGANINLRGGYYGTALGAAVSRGDEEAVDILVENGADVNIRGGPFGSALQAAISGGFPAIAVTLLRKGADVDVPGGPFGTALQAAICQGFGSIAAMLIEKGADVNERGGNLGTALQVAAYQGRETIARLLVENGADVNAQGGEYGTALQAAAYQGHHAVVSMLLRKGAKVDEQGGTYCTALQAAAYRGNEITVAMLLEKEADTNANGGKYHTALQAAAYEGHTTIVTKLLQKGASVNAQGGPYFTALHAAAYQGHKSIVAELLENGADINAQGGTYGTALRAAACQGCKIIMSMLLDNGAKET